MSEQDAGTEQHEQGYEIVVNGAPPVPVQETVTYDEVVDIAYPGGRSDPDAIFRADYEDAASKPHSGPLAEGGSVEVKHRGTEFSVVRSVRS